MVVCTDVDGKDDAILAVTEIARATGPHFVQFIDRVFEPLSAACRSFFSEEVRTLAISSMGALLEVRACVRACVWGKGGGGGGWRYEARWEEVSALQARM